MQRENKMKLVAFIVLCVLSLATVPAMANPNRLMARKDKEENLQTFTGALGNIKAPAVIKKGDLFFVVGGPSGESFTQKANALQRSCDRQSNLCANHFNTLKNGGGQVGNCLDKQLKACKNLIK